MAIEAKDSIYSTFAAAAARWGDRPFLHAPADAIGTPEAFDRDFGDAAEEVEALRRRYEILGYGFGHRIGLALDNHPQFFLHLLALNALGASVVPINSAMRAEELAAILGMADLDLVVSWPKHFGGFGTAQGIALCFVPLAPASLDGCPAASRPVRDGRAGADDEAAMLFTSGTTGRPKGCVLSNAYFTWIGDFYANLGGYCAFREGEDRILTPLPVNHMNAIACSFMAAIMTGSCLIQFDRFHASRWWRTVRETRASVIHYLGVMPAILLVPTALSAIGSQLFKSLEMRDTTANTKFPVSNSHQGKFRVEVSRYLGNAKYPGFSAKAWYLLAEPTDLPVIEVAFLNGQEAPTIETAEADFNVLGVQMRGYHDFGVALQDPRGGVKAKGEV